MYNYHRILDTHTKNTTECASRALYSYTCTIKNICKKNSKQNIFSHFYIIQLFNADTTLLGFIYTFWHSLSSTSSMNRGSIPFIICRWLVQKDFNNISASFQNLFVVFFTWKSFYTHLFCSTEMRWLFISSTAIWVTGSDTGSVASRARTELTSSKCDWTRIWNIKNVDETNFS